jgi:hypothetical protein
MHCIIVQEDVVMNNSTYNANTHCQRFAFAEGKEDVGVCMGCLRVSNCNNCSFTSFYDYTLKLMIRENFLLSRDAPPTKAPSMSC